MAAVEVRRVELDINYVMHSLCSITHEHINTDIIMIKHRFGVEGRFPLSYLSTEAWCHTVWPS